jgi:tetratricopeptide (TPR) repeat protein
MKSSTYRRFLAVAVIAALVPGCESKQAREAKYIQQGKDLLAQGQIDQALLAFKNALRVNPIDPEPRYYLGEALERKGDLNNAFISFSTAVQQNPHYDPALLKVGRYYFSAGQTDEAAKRIAVVLADNPDNADANAIQAAIDLRRKDYARCEQDARIALDRDQTNIIARSVLGGLYGIQGHLDAAARIIDDGIKLNPQDVSLVLLKAQLFQKYPIPGKVDEAYKTLLERRPLDPNIRDQVAKYYVHKKDPDTAEAVLREGLRLAPGDRRMRQELVAFLGDVRGLVPAEKEIRGYMAADPQTDDYYFWLADLYVKYSAADRAMALLNELVQKRGMEQPGLDARTSLAQITFQHGDVPLANKLLSIVLAADPGNKDALFVRARIEFDQGKFESANNDLRSILRSDATSESALQLLSESLLSEGHLDLAIDTLSTLLDAAPGDLPARVRLVQLYHANRNTKRALELLADLEKVAPNYPVVWETEARIQLDEKDWSDADAAIVKLDTFPGQHLTAQYLRGESAQRQGDLDSAIGYYTNIIKAAPNSGLSERAQASLVQSYGQKHKPADALALLTSLNLDTAFNHTLRGDLDLALKKPDDAIREFQRAVAEKGGRADPYLQLARQYFQKGDVKGAEAVLTQAMTDVPSDMRPRMVLGDIETSRGEYNDAIANYQALLDINPALDAAANNIAELIADYLYTDPVALERARVAADRFQTSTNPLLLDTVGWVYYREGNFSQSATFLQRAISFGKVPPQVHYHYGMLLLKQNQKDQAKQELTLATKGDPHYAGVDEAKQMLAGL